MGNSQTMKDTTPEMEEMYYKKIMSFSPQERLMMACDMYTTAKKLVISSLPKDLTEAEKRVEVFLRFYGNDFSEEEKAKRIEYLKKDL